MSILPLVLMPLAALALAWLVRRPLLRAAARFLVIHDGDDVDADVIVLMNGNISTRPYLAAEYYRRRRVPVLLARLADTEEVRLGVIPNVSEATVTLLERLGVVAGDVELLGADGWVSGTWNEALLHRDRIRAGGWRRIVVVTDAFHTRRARWAFRQLMSGDGVEIRCAATRFSRDLAERWWSNEYSLVQVVVEYLKFLHYRRSRRRFPTEAADLPAAAAVRRMARGA